LAANQEQTWQAGELNARVHRQVNAVQNCAQLKLQDPTFLRDDQRSRQAGRPRQIHKSEFETV